MPGGNCPDANRRTPGRLQMKPDRKPDQTKRAIPGSRSGEIVKKARAPALQGWRQRLLQNVEDGISGTRIERKPNAERLLPRCAFGPSQLFGNLSGGGFLFRQALQFTHFGRRPRAPFL